MMRRLYGFLMVVAMVLVPTAATPLAEGPPPASETARQTTGPAPAPAAPAPVPAPAPPPETEAAPPTEPPPAPQTALKQGETLAAPPVPAEKGGGVTAKPKQTAQPEQDKGSESPQYEEAEVGEEGGGVTATAPPSAFSIPSIPSS